jgi:hypothetical protein
MAEANVRTTICDLCGKPSFGLTLNFKDDTGSYQLDICGDDLKRLRSVAHVPRRGRKPGSVTRKKTAVRRPATAKHRKATAAKRE